MPKRKLLHEPYIDVTRNNAFSASASTVSDTVAYDLRSSRSWCDVENSLDWLQDKLDEQCQSSTVSETRKHAELKFDREDYQI